MSAAVRSPKHPARGFCAALAVLAFSISTPGARASIRVDGTDYDSAGSFAASLGMKTFWSKPKETLVLQSPWTRLELDADSREARLNGIRLLLGDATVISRGELQISDTDEELFLGPILSTRRIRGAVPGARTIVVDAGHGGKDTGTLNKKLKYEEKNVVMTRDSDTFIPLENRPALAKRVHADLFVSIHFNAISNASITGAETYVLTPRGQHSTGADGRQPADIQANPGDAFDAWNSILGYRVHKHVITDLKSFDRGLKRARFVVLRELPCPGILVEGGYLTNDAEARRIASPEWRARLARAITDGIIEYRDVLDQARGK